MVNSQNNVINFPSVNKNNRVNMFHNLPVRNKAWRLQTDTPIPLFKRTPTPLSDAEKITSVFKKFMQ